MALTAALALAAVVVGQTPTPAEPVRRTSLTGTIEKIEGFESKALGNRRNLIVYLPPNYAKEPNRRYPVLYLHDGQNVFDGMTSYLPNREWRLDESAQALIQAGLIEPIIMVGIDNGGVERANEYLPIEITFNWNQPTKAGGKADLYGKMLLDEIKPMIDARYRTKRGGRDTGLMGSSFGGVITLYLGLKHPNRFGKLGVISPSIWVGERYLLKQIDGLPKATGQKIWLDMGASEGGQALRDARDTYTALQRKGWQPGRNLVYFEDGFAEHNEDAWARRGASILTFLYGRSGR